MTANEPPRRKMLMPDGSMFFVIYDQDGPLNEKWLVFWLDRLSAGQYEVLGRYRTQRSAGTAAAAMIGEYMKQIPDLDEATRRNFERLAGGLLQVNPTELEEASKTAPSDNEERASDEEQ